jgi:hypothetical protein
MLSLSSDSSILSCSASTATWVRRRSSMGNSSLSVASNQPGPSLPSSSRPTWQQQQQQQQEQQQQHRTLEGRHMCHTKQSGWRQTSQGPACRSRHVQPGSSSSSSSSSSKSSSAEGGTCVTTCNHDFSQLHTAAAAAAQHELIAAADDHTKQSTAQHTDLAQRHTAAAAAPLTMNSQVPHQAEHTSKHPPSLDRIQQQQQQQQQRSA